MFAHSPPTQWCNVFHHFLVINIQKLQWDSLTGCGPTAAGKLPGCTSSELRAIQGFMRWISLDASRPRSWSALAKEWTSRLRHQPHDHLAPVCRPAGKTDAARLPSSNLAPATNPREKTGPDRQARLSCQPHRLGCPGGGALGGPAEQRPGVLLRR